METKLDFLHFLLHILNNYCTLKTKKCLHDGGVIFLAVRTHAKGYDFYTSAKHIPTWTQPLENGS